MIKGGITMKKVIAIMMYGCLIFLFWNPVGAAIHHVHPGPGTPIQDAIHVAHPGDTIIVYPGTYTDPITLSKHDLTLISAEGPDTTIIDYTGIWCGYWSTGNGGVDIPVGVSGVCVEGFTIRGGSPASDALISIGGDDTIIRNNYVMGDPGSSGQDIGIHIGNVPEESSQYPCGNQIINNEVYNHAGSGIFIGNWAGSGTLILGNTVHDNVIGGIPGLNGNGIEIDRALGVQVERNRVYNNEAAGVKIIRTAPGALIHVSRNILYANGNGIHSEQWRPGATSSAQVTATCNNIVDNTQYGIRNDENVIITAHHNWWGHTSGPFHPTSNAQGTGNRVSEHVAFIPWGKVPDPCDLRISGSEYTLPFRRQLCPLARNNVAIAEDMLEAAQELLEVLSPGIEEQEQEHDEDHGDALSTPYEEALSLIAEAESLLEQARIYCLNSQNCIAGNSLAIEAIKLLENAHELLEGILQ
ncbi:MAG: right-handed parallel beta-helix repeat-containing protein [Theionarchaea archaeon]|nr:right-handed parallel beta-helix repeat-containing protein [Theionarchaea archaeon]